METLCFSNVLCSGGSKSGLTKAAGAEPSGQMRNQKLPFLWREARFENNTLKTSHSRSTFGSWDLRCRKSAHTMFGALLALEMFRTCTPLWREARFEVKGKNPTCSDHFWTLNRHFAWHEQGILHLAQNKENVVFCGSFKDNGSGTFEEDLQGCISLGRRSTKDISIRHVQRTGRWFPDTLHFGASDRQVC